MIIKNEGLRWKIVFSVVLSSDPFYSKKQKTVLASVVKEALVLPELNHNPAASPH